MEATMKNQTGYRRRVYTVPEVAHILGISRNAAYKLVNTEKGFVTVRIGKSIRIPIESFETWLNEQSFDQRR